MKSRLPCIAGLPARTLMPIGHYVANAQPEVKKELSASA